MEGTIVGSTRLMSVFDLMHRLDRAAIHYDLASVRDGALMVQVSVPGERLEVEFFEDGNIEVERFVSTGKIESSDVLDELIAKHTDVKD
jgi:hypothetical protein